MTIDRIFMESIEFRIVFMKSQGFSRRPDLHGRLRHRRFATHYADQLGEASLEALCAAAFGRRVLDGGRPLAHGDMITFGADTN